MLKSCCLALLAALSQPASAGTCLPFLPAPNAVVSLTLVTMNKNGVASFAESQVARREGAVPNTGRPPRLVTRAGSPAVEPTPQVFSDRLNGFLKTPVQRFDASQADDLVVEVTLEASPQVTVTLASWGNAKASFRATCSPGGVMHGSTADVDYLLFLRASIVN
jgi:hypothetical protein